MNKTELERETDRQAARADFLSKLPRPSRVLRVVEVCARSGFARTTIWKRVKDGTFPAPIDIGGGRIGWRESEFEAWLESRPRAQWAPRAVAA